MSGSKKRNDAAQDVTNEEVTDYARIAFDAYRDKRAGRSFTGGSIPDWEGATSDIQEAWRTAIDAVLDALVGNSE